ncbi:hypothetical protein ACFSTA_18805 [Ornithinibacillus salinisoli]|uniref:Uncharacterized protein n=1 Tax=Ornithinibacillus salinisoli TaxID=1848459 RepID=A0ABW4W3U3_9BACI
MNNALKRHKDKQEKAKRINGAYYSKDFIFTNSYRYPGYPILINTVENRMKRLLKIAGLNQELTPYDIRTHHFLQKLMWV